jgi:phage host-nuclease inhibitor protein Gam
MENELAIQHEIKPEFAIVDLNSATWAVGKMTALDSKESIVKAQYKAMMDDIENDRKFLMARFGAQLMTWTLENAKKGAKSVKLLTGTVSVRTVPEAFFIADEDKFLEWALEHLPEVLKEKTVTHIDKKAVEEYFKKTGEVPDGCDVKPSEERVYVKG